MSDAATSAVTYSSDFGFNVHELDFDPAFEDDRVKSLRHSTEDTIPGAIIMMPRLRNEECEFHDHRATKYSQVSCRRTKLFSRFTREHTEVNEHEKRSRISVDEEARKNLPL
jgi:hypothetical protein